MPETKKPSLIVCFNNGKNELRRQSCSVETIIKGSTLMAPKIKLSIRETFVIPKAWWCW
jgi:hypothetical protein